MRYDFWKDTREQATVEGGLKVLRGENVKGLPTAMMWKPKAIKPFINYYYKSIDDREKSIKGKIESFILDRANTKKRTQERKGTPEMLKQIEVGTIFNYSWGYDQTNQDYFQVTQLKGQFVVIREIASGMTGTGQYCSNSGHVMPIKNEFTGNALRKKVQFSRGKAYLTMATYGWCSVWDGKPNHASWGR